MNFLCKASAPPKTKLAATEWLNFRKRKGLAGKIEIKSAIEQLIGEFEEMVDLDELLMSVVGTRADIQSNNQDAEVISGHLLVSVVQHANNALHLLFLQGTESNNIVHASCMRRLTPNAL
jgi:hypothetical protein